MSVSLTSGSVSRHTLRLALPALFSMLLTALSQQAEALLLSRTSTEAAVAVAACFPLLTLAQTVGFTLGTGAGGCVSRSLGRRQTRDALRVSSCALLLCVFFGAPFLLAGLFFSSAIVRLLGVPGEGLLLAARYARWFLLAAPLLLLNLTLGCLLRAQGCVMAGLAASILAALVCLPLSFLLLVRHPLGVVGAGIVMLAREVVSVCVLLAFALSRRALRPSLRLARPSAAVLRAMLPSGVPTLVRQVFMTLAAGTTTRIAASFGPSVLSGMGMALRLLTLVSSAVIGFGHGFQPVCGVNFGAGRIARVREAYAFSLRVIRTALLLVAVPLFLFASRLSALLLPDAASAAVCAAALRAQALTLWAQGIVTLMTSLTQSMGLAVRGSLVASGRQGYVLLPLLLILPRVFGLSGLVFAQSVSDILSLGIALLLTRSLMEAHPRATCLTFPS